MQTFSMVNYWIKIKWKNIVFQLKSLVRWQIGNHEPSQTVRPIIRKFYNSSLQFPNLLDTFIFVFLFFFNFKESQLMFTGTHFGKHWTTVYTSVLSDPRLTFLHHLCPLLSKSFELEACWNIHDQVLEAMILQSGMGITQGIY